MIVFCCCLKCKITGPLQLSVIIVNYNVKYFLEQCLVSVVKACKNIEAEILVADNHSSDGSKEFFKDRFSEVQFIWLNQNDGFAKANNIALQRATGEKILFLNPDTILPEDCLEACVGFLSTKKDMGVLGVRMIDGSGKYLPESKRGFPSLFTSFCKLSGLTKMFPHSKLLANYYLGHLSENKTAEVDVLAGAFMMISKKALDEVGSFDEAFFMYAEDIDFSYRIQKAGYKNYYFADSTILHFKGESTQKETLQYIRIFYGAMLLFVKKHYGNGVSSLYGLMIQNAIVAKTLSAGIKKLVRKPAASTGKQHTANKAYLIGNAQHFQHIHQQLQQYFSHVTPAENVNEITSPVDALILCEPTLSFKEMIAVMEQHRQQYEFFIHADRTKSMVGSSDKNTSGKFIPIN